MIIHVIKNAHNKSDVETKSQRTVAAFSMLYAYTFMETYWDIHHVMMYQYLKAHYNKVCIPYYTYTN